jgi:hypothetical protein
LRDVRFALKSGHKLAGWEWPVGVQAQIIERLADVRFGSQTNFDTRLHHFRFAPDSGHSSVRLVCRRGD